MKLAEIVGKNILYRRKEIGLSQKELAGKLGITQDALTRMEKGRIAPKMSRLADITSVLQIPVSYLFRSHDDMLAERTATIADILATLPDSGQEAMINPVAEVARVMNLSRDD